MKILFIVPRDVDARGHARLASLRMRMVAFAARHEVHLIYLHDVRRADALACAEALLPGVSLHPVPSPRLLGMALGAGAAVMSGAPLQGRIFSPGSIIRRVEAIAAEILPDIIVYDTLRTDRIHAALGRRLPGARHVMDLDDLFSKRYRRMRKSNYRQSILGHFGRQVPRSVNRAADALGVLLLAYEARTISRLELRAAGAYDAVVLTSKEEARELAALASKFTAASASVMGVPHLIPELDFSSDVQQLQDRSYYFVGNYAMPHNVAALEWILRDIVPLVRASVPDSRFHVFGPGLPASSLDLVYKTPGVEHHEYVASLRDAVASIPILLSPLLFGTGIKTKIVEALGWGKAVVTNGVGIEGIQAEPDVDYVLAEDARSLASATVDLLLNARRRARIGEAGCRRAFVEFSERAIMEEWEKLVENLHHSPNGNLQSDVSA